MQIQKSVSIFAVQKHMISIALTPNNYILVLRGHSLNLHNCRCISGSKQGRMSSSGATRRRPQRCLLAGRVALRLQLPWLRNRCFCQVRGHRQLCPFSPTAPVKNSLDAGDWAGRRLPLPLSPAARLNPPQRQPLGIHPAQGGRGELHQALASLGKTK